MFPLLLADFTTKRSISIRANLLCFEKIVKRMKLCRNGQYLLLICSFGNSCTINCVQLNIYIYSYMSKKQLLQPSYVIGIWREFLNNPLLLLLLFLVCMDFLFCFCVVKCYLKKKRKGEKHDYCLQAEKLLLFYTTENPKLKLFKANIWFKSFIWCGLKVDKFLVFSKQWKMYKCLAVLPINFVYFNNFNCSNCIIFCNLYVQFGFVFHF